MRFDEFIKREEILNEGSLFQNLIKKIGNKSTSVIRKLLKNNWTKLANILKKNNLESDALTIINRNLKTKFKSLDQIEKMKISEERVDEDFSHYWQLIKQEGFPSLAFYPILQVWFEIDKLLKDTGDANLKVIVAYGLLWAFLISGKHIKGWLDWRKINPEEFEKEGGKKHPFAIKGKK